MKSGVPGIYWHKRTRAWMVRNWQDVHIATFDEDDLETAKLCGGGAHQRRGQTEAQMATPIEAASTQVAAQSSLRGQAAVGRTLGHVDSSGEGLIMATFQIQALVVSGDEWDHKKAAELRAEALSLMNDLLMKGYEVVSACAVTFDMGTRIVYTLFNPDHAQPSFDNGADDEPPAPTIDART